MTLTSMSFILFQQISFYHSVRSNTHFVVTLSCFTRNCALSDKFLKQLAAPNMAESTEIVTTFIIINITHPDSSVSSTLKNNEIEFLLNFFSEILLSSFFHFSSARMNCVSYRNMIFSLKKDPFRIVCCV
jgi:hypothetical protein